MRKVSDWEITENQFMYILIGTMIGTAILSLPNNMSKISKQDGWISVIVASWYPILIVLFGIYFMKKCPNEDILALSKKYYGKFLGSILCFIFTLQFVVELVSVSAGYSNISRIYIIEFLTPIKIISLTLIIGVYATFQGLKVVGRISEVAFYFLILLLFIPLIALRDGSMLNVSPIFGTGYKNIVVASKDAMFAYTGIEIIYFIYPNVKDKKRLPSKALKAAFGITFIYAYVTFMTIYYLGSDVISKVYWSVMIINETVNLPFINSFRFIFMFLWSIIILKTIVSIYYAVSYGLSNAIFKFPIKKLCFIIYPIILFLAIKYGNEISRRNIIRTVNPIITCYNLIYITILAILIHFRKDKENEAS